MRIIDPLFSRRAVRFTVFQDENFERHHAGMPEIDPHEHRLMIHDFGT